MPTTYRQLALNVFKDNVEYTNPTGDYEKSPFVLLHKNRKYQGQIIDKHYDRWIKEMRNGILASIPRVSKAVYYNRFL